MRAFREAVIEVLRKRGAMELRALVAASLRVMPRKGDPTQEVLEAALSGAWGIRVVEWPKYELRVPKGSIVVPRQHGYIKRAVSVLKSAKGGVSLPEIVEGYRARDNRRWFRCPEYYMLRCLDGRVLGPKVRRRGVVRVDLATARRKRMHKAGRLDRVRKPASEPAPIAERIDEKSLETLLVNRPELLEVGLTVFQRQCRIPVGIIDLLCVDKDRNYVVVEIKRPSADYREVVGQITSYMGWVRKHIAGGGQLVRGIIVVGRRNDKLDYSLELVPDVSVRTFF